MGNYTIRQNESIYRLAALFYYNYTLWPLIYYTNENVIGNDPFSLKEGLKIFIPKPLVNTAHHIAKAGESAQSLSEKYYGIEYYHIRIDKENDFPIRYSPGIEYRIPSILTQIELDAATEQRRNLHVEFDR